MRMYVKRLLPLAFTIALLVAGAAYSVTTDRMVDPLDIEVTNTTPCAGGSCEPRDISGFAPFAPLAGSGVALELPPADHTVPR